MDSCSPPLAGGEHIVLQQKLEPKMLKQRYRFGSRDFKKSSTEATFCRVLGLLVTVFLPCNLLCETFYDTLP